MTNLINKKCVPCEGGMPPLTAEEIKGYLPELKEGREVLEDKKLTRSLNLKTSKKP